MSSNHHKTCTACGLRKPIGAFSRKAENPDGRRHHCRDCVSDRGREYRAANPDKVKASKASWAERNVEKMQEMARRFRDRKGGYKGETARLRQSNPEAYARRTHLWAKRRAARERATPPWYDDAKVKAIYLQAARMRRAGFDVHVDHIIPLRGDLACGLHVHNNLRIIGAKENISKGAKCLPDMLKA
jgi:hypothetical protein